MAAFPAGHVRRAHANVATAIEETCSAFQPTLVGRQCAFDNSRWIFVQSVHSVQIALAALRFVY